jgi:hypothetical protein
MMTGSHHVEVVERGKIQNTLNVELKGQAGSDLKMGLEDKKFL